MKDCAKCDNKVGTNCTAFDCKNFHAIPFYEKVAKHMGWGISEGKNLVEVAVSGLIYKKNAYGKMYCPCVAPNGHNQDTICPCTEFRQAKEGVCHCGLYVKE